MGVGLFFTTPGVKHCIRCTLDNSEFVTWKVEVPEKSMPVDVGSETVQYAIEVNENFLVLFEPEMFVWPGIVGAREIRCTGMLTSSIIKATIASPGN